MSVLNNIFKIIRNIETQKQCCIQGYTFTETLLLARPVCHILKKRPFKEVWEFFSSDQSFAMPLSAPAGRCHNYTIWHTWEFFTFNGYSKEAVFYFILFFLFEGIKKF